MTVTTSSATHKTYQQAKKGIILINFGSPMTLTKSGIRTFLWRLLTDQRVVSLPRLLWWPILLGFILPFRPKRLIHDYERIWLEKGSPLLVYHDELTHALNAHLPEYEVTQAHLYADPSLKTAWQSLKKKGVRQVLLLPLYPQYASATTASVLDVWHKVMQKELFVPGFRFVASYHDDPMYIQALASSVRDHWQKTGKRSHLIFSYHGIPKEKFDQGDPYYCYCHKTTRLVAESLGLTETDYSMAFQSRFGKQTWLKPYLNEHIKSLIESGQRELTVICPGFSFDCIETTHEVGFEYQAEAQELGGHLSLVPCLNNSKEAFNLYQSIIQNTVF